VTVVAIVTNAGAVTETAVVTAGATARSVLVATIAELDAEIAAGSLARAARLAAAVAPAPSASEEVVGGIDDVATPAPVPVWSQAASVTTARVDALRRSQLRRE
jgi:hypothetical protein